MRRMSPQCKLRNHAACDGRTAERRRNSQTRFKCQCNCHRKDAVSDQ